MTEISSIQKITPEQSAAIVALLSNPTRQAAAAAVGVSESTLYRWMREETFLQALSNAQRAVVQESVRRLLAEQAACIDTLIDLRSNGTPRDGVRLKAALAILERGTEMREALALEDRLAALESLVERIGEAL